ncbi:hypothetical protein ES703_05272 [subsurface metagenome]
MIPKIRIVDVHKDASGKDRFVDSSGKARQFINLNDEYAIIENSSNIDVKLDGWYLRDAAGHKFRFPKGFVLKKNSRVTIHTGTGANTTTHLYWGHKMHMWNNEGDVAILFARMKTTGYCSGEFYDKPKHSNDKSLRHYKCNLKSHKSYPTHYYCYCTYNLNKHAAGVVNGKEVPAHPKYNITASGTSCKHGTLAADTRIFPFGTKLEIPVYGKGTVEDVGKAIKKMCIDLWFPSHQKALEWGVEELTVEIHRLVV